MLSLTRLVAKAWFLQSLFPGNRQKSFSQQRQKNTKAGSARNEEEGIQFSGMGWLAPLSSRKEISSTPTLVAGGRAQPPARAGTRPLLFHSVRITSEPVSTRNHSALSLTPTHTVLISPEFLTWYSHFSHQKIPTGAWALCQLFKLILFLAIRILSVELHKDKLMLWNYLKKSKAQNFSILGLSNPQVI